MEIVWSVAGTSAGGLPELNSKAVEDDEQECERLFNQYRGSESTKHLTIKDFTKLRQRAQREIDPSLVQRVNNIIAEYGAANVAILGLSVKQEWCEAQRLSLAISTTAALTVNGKRIREGEVTVSSITSFKGLERDVIILTGFDSVFEEIYRDDPGALLNQYYVGATRAKKLLVVTRSKANAAFASLRDASKFFKVESLSDEQREIVNLVVKQRANVLVNAVAGSGKTRTALTTAVAAVSAPSLPDEVCPYLGADDRTAFMRHHDNRHQVLVLAYNKLLSVDVQRQADEGIRASQRALIKVSTIHALANAYFFSKPDRCFVRDGELNDIVAGQKPLLVTPPLRLVVVDEAQDLTPALLRFLRYFLSLLPIKPQLLVCGDVFQLIYKFNGAAAECFLDPEANWKLNGTPLWRVPRDTTQPAWQFRRLSISFRITHGMADFINKNLNPLNFERVPQVKAW